MLPNPEVPGTAFTTKNSLAPDVNVADVGVLPEVKEPHSFSPRCGPLVPGSRL